MTLPDERYRAVVQTQKLLEDILMGKYKRVPKEIKERVRGCLRHYPSEWDMEHASETAPNVFQKQMEPLYRMVKVYDMEKKGEVND